MNDPARLNVANGGVAMRRLSTLGMAALLLLASGIPGTAHADEPPYPIAPYLEVRTLTDSVTRIPFTVTDPKVCSVTIDRNWSAAPGATLTGAMPSYVLTIDTRTWDTFSYDYNDPSVALDANYCTGGEYLVNAYFSPAVIAHVDNAVTSRVGRAPLKVTVGFAVSDGEHFNDEFMTRVDFVRNGKVEYSRSVTDSQAAALAATTGDELGVISYRIPVGKESGRWSIRITTPFDQWSQPVTITRNPSKPGKPRPASTPVRVSTPITPTPEMALATITTITTSRDAAGRAQIAIAGMNTRLLVSVLFLPADLRVPNIAGKYCTYKEAVADPVGCTMTFTSQAAGSSEATVYINAIAGNLQRQETVTFPRLRN